MGYFKDLIEASKTKNIHNKGNKIIGMPWFLWFFSPLFLILTYVTWLDFKVLIGTIIYFFVSYYSGIVVIKSHEKFD